VSLTSGGTHIPTLRGRCILLVEDEFLIALDLWQLFDAEGCRVLGPAPTVTEALRMLATGPPPDAAVLDVNLHGTRSGPVAAELVARGIPFVVTTAYPSLPEPAFNGAGQAVRSGSSPRDSPEPAEWEGVIGRTCARNRTNELGKGLAVFSMHLPKENE
jgi:CheY-like chemotaxis protein